MAQAKAERALMQTLLPRYGLRDQDPDFRLAYQESKPDNKPSDWVLQCQYSTGDWGRGRYRMAQSSLELAQVQSDQAIVDFEQNLFLDVEQFNLQTNQVAIAAKSDTVAMKMFEVTKQRFLIGKIAVLELNNADTRKTRTRELMFRHCRITGIIFIIYGTSHYTIL